MLFRDRSDAGRQLASKLMRYANREEFAAEAGTIHPDVFVADDLAQVTLPGRGPAL